MFDYTKINFFVAFAGGAVTFLASCLLPLVPTYLAYLTGLSLSSDDVRKREVFINALLFTTGFILTFVLLGLTATTLGKTLALNRDLIQRVGGVFFIFMGLLILGVIKPQFLLKNYQLPKIVTGWKELNSFLMGIAFGFAWTPCIGPVLAVILFWASQASTILKGTGLLLGFGLGLGTPFLLIAVMFEQLLPRLKELHKVGVWVNYAAGVLVIIAGVLLMVGKLGHISIAAINFFGLDALTL